MKRSEWMDGYQDVYLWALWGLSCRACGLVCSSMNEKLMIYRYPSSRDLSLALCWGRWGNARSIRSVLSPFVDGYKRAKKVQSMASCFRYRHECVLSGVVAFFRAGASNCTCLTSTFCVVSFPFYTQALLKSPTRLMFRYLLSYPEVRFGEKTAYFTLAPGKIIRFGVCSPFPFLAFDFELRYFRK
jgi:hypothetical protein